MSTVITGETHQWLSPFERSVEAVLARRGKPTVVLASGDPFFYGVGATLSRRIPADEMAVIPAPSSFSLAASRLGWPLQETTVLSLHGRPIDLIRPHLHPGRRILALTSDSEGPAELAALLQASGFGQSELTVLEALGGPHEKISQQKADDFTLSGINDLNICGVEVKADQLLTWRLSLATCGCFINSEFANPGSRTSPVNNNDLVQVLDADPHHRTDHVC